MFFIRVTMKIIIWRNRSRNERDVCRKALIHWTCLMYVILVQEMKQMHCYLFVEPFNDKCMQTYCVYDLQYVRNDCVIETNSRFQNPKKTQICFELFVNASVFQLSQSDVRRFKKISAFKFEPWKACERK